MSTSWVKALPPQLKVCVASSLARFFASSLKALQFCLACVFVGASANFLSASLVLSLVISFTTCKQITSTLRSTTCTTHHQLSMSKNQTESTTRVHHQHLPIGDHRPIAQPPD